VARPGGLEILLHRSGDGGNYQEITDQVLTDSFELMSDAHGESCSLRLLAQPLGLPHWRPPVPAIGDVIAVRQRSTSSTGEWSSQLFRGAVTFVRGEEFAGGAGRIVWSVRAEAQRLASVTSLVQDCVTVEWGGMEPGRVIKFTGGNGGGAAKIPLKVREALNEHKIADGSARRKIRIEEL
jgi:hypothetical protein